MEISSSQYADVVVAVPVGRIDHQRAGELEAALAPLLQRVGIDKGTVLLDFTGIEYVSSVGLRVLMIAAKQLRAAGARIAVAHLQPVVAEIFAISRFDRVLDVFPSVRSALAQFSAAASAAYDADQRPGPT